jgi:hypothetical protein
LGWRWDSKQRPHQGTQNPRKPVQDQPSISTAMKAYESLHLVAFEVCV